MSSKYRHQADAAMGGISSVVSSLPIGMTLGESRHLEEIDYRLVYNNGGAQIVPGEAAVQASVGPYSLTVTSTSKGDNHVGAVVCHHATATTSTYFWGVTRGYLPEGVVGDNASTPTGSFIAIGSNGSFNLMPGSVVTGKVVSGKNLGSVASATVTTGARSGDVYINFL